MNLYESIKNNISDTYDPADDSFYQADCDDINEVKATFTNGSELTAEEAKRSIKDTLSNFPIGIILCTNYKETVSGYTSRGGYSHEYATIIKYEKIGDNQWKDNRWNNVIDDNSFASRILWDESNVNLEKQAKKDQEEIKKTLHSEHRDYAPVSNIDKDNPHWDGNKYAI